MAGLILGSAQNSQDESGSVDRLSPSPLILAFGDPVMPVCLGITHQRSDQRLLQISFAHQSTTYLRHHRVLLRPQLARRVY